MPRVVRRRRLDAPPRDDLVGRLRSLPPAALVAADAAGRERHRRATPRAASWTQVLETRDGRGVRADYRCISAAADERYIFEQLIEGTPFAGILQSARTEIRLAARGRAAPRSPWRASRSCAGLSRLGGFMMRRATGRTLSEALTGLERAVGGGETPRRRRAERSRRLQVVGLGRRRAARSSCPDAAVSRAPRASSGSSRATPPSRSRSTRSSCPRRGRCPEPVRARGRRRRASSPATEDRLRRAAGRSYPDLIRLRTGRLEHAPDAVLVPERRRARWRRLLAACAEAGVAVVPYGGGSSVVGGLDARRGDHTGRRLARPGQAPLGRARPDLADRAGSGPGLRGPEAEEALGELGSRSATSRSPSSRRRSAASPRPARPGQASSGYGRFDELVTAIELTTPDRGRCGRSRSRTPPRARRCASWCSAPRGPWA